MSVEILFFHIYDKIYMYIKFKFYIYVVKYIFMLNMQDEKLRIVHTGLVSNKKRESLAHGYHSLPLKMWSKNSLSLCIYVHSCLRSASEEEDRHL